MPPQHRTLHRLRLMAHTQAGPQGQYRRHTLRPRRDERTGVPARHPKLHGLHRRQRRHRHPRHEAQPPRDGLRLHPGRPLRLVAAQQVDLSRRLIPREARPRHGPRIYQEEQLLLECRHLHLERGHHHQCLPHLPAQDQQPLRSHDACTGHASGATGHQ